MRNAAGWPRERLSEREFQKRIRLVNALTGINVIFYARKYSTVKAQKSRRAERERERECEDDGNGAGGGLFPRSGLSRRQKRSENQCGKTALRARA